MSDISMPNFNQFRTDVSTGKDTSPDTDTAYETASPDPRITGFLLDPSFRSNPGFFLRSRNHGMIGKFPRGRIVQARRETEPLGPGVALYHRACNFLFNPGQIVQSYQFTDQTPIDQATGDLSVSIISGQSVGFDLYFDRTFELAYPRSDPSNPATEVGVLADVGALENICRANFGAPTKAIPVIVTFGATATGKPWSFYGWMNGFEVTFTQFNYRMIPQRAGVHIQLTRIFTPSAQGAMTNTAPAGSPPPVPGVNVGTPGHTQPGWN